VTGSARRRPPVVLVLGLAAVTLAVADASGPGRRGADALRQATRGAVAPLEAATRAVAGAVGDSVSGVRRAGTARRAQARLAAEVTRLRGVLAVADATAAEGRRLTAAVGVVPADARAGAPAAVPARVVSLGSDSAGSTLLLDRGHREGIRPGMTVLSAGALVGRVVGATAHRATVLPVAARGSAVAVRVAGGGDLGVVEGRGRRRPLTLELLDDRAAPLGELVVTAGVGGGRYPGGLPVGRVTAGGRVRALVDWPRLEAVVALPWEGRR
jgi:rod shape-determining protein MreC